ncbi:hypothetical protein TELCIR_11446 [Teladorsagia circumcincta]|uniref:Uncharacterized protein n=1 Tax=Teladorsagia circumcincta TaxID=45464 RepID=A0A2G9U986_TELCI|nr:hypothetical protein TELCIR_11446 [Teladorsagia circumcincta]
MKWDPALKLNHVPFHQSATPSTDSENDMCKAVARRGSAIHPIELESEAENTDCEDQLPNYMPPPQPPPNKPPRPPNSPPPPVQQQQQPQHPPPPPPKSPQRIDCDGVTLNKSTKIEIMMAIFI